MFAGHPHGLIQRSRTGRSLSEIRKTDPQADLALHAYDCSGRATNTIMCKAVSDAAAWYDKAEWVGIVATPQATLLILAREQQAGHDVGHVMIDYPVPMNDSSKPSLRAVNWPKASMSKGSGQSGVTSIQGPRAWNC